MCLKMHRAQTQRPEMRQGAGHAMFIAIFILWRWSLSSLWSWSCRGVRLRLWTAATNGPTVHPPGDTSTENQGGLMSVEETPDSCTRALWQSYHHSHLVASRRYVPRERLILPSKASSFIFVSDFLHAVISYDMGPTALLPLRRMPTRNFRDRRWKKRIMLCTNSKDH
jgi:hypothetical protein